MPYHHKNDVPRLEVKKVEVQRKQRKRKVASSIKVFLKKKLSSKFSKKIIKTVIRKKSKPKNKVLAPVLNDLGAPIGRRISTSGKMGSRSNSCFFVAVEQALRLQNPALRFHYTTAIDSVLNAIDSNLYIAADFNAFLDVERMPVNSTLAQIRARVLSYRNRSVAVPLELIRFFAETSQLSINVRVLGRDAHGPINQFLRFNPGAPREVNIYLEANPRGGHYETVRP